MHFMATALGVVMVTPDAEGIHHPLRMQEAESMENCLLLFTGTISILLISGFVIGVISDKWKAWRFVVELISKINPLGLLREARRHQKNDK